MKNSFHLILLLALIITGCASQKNVPVDSLAAASDSTSLAAKADSTKKKKDKPKGPKAFKDLIDSTFKSQQGLFGVHSKEDDYYFEIPEELFGKEIMAITRFSKTAAGAGVFGGEEVNRQVVRFEKGPSDKIFLRSVTYVIVSQDSTKPMAQAVKNSSSDPIIGSFEIKAVKKLESDSTKNGSYIISIANEFLSDNQVFSFDSRYKKRLNITSFKKDASYLESIKTYPINTEIRTVKTFGVSSPVPGKSRTGRYFPAGLDAGVVTMEFNTSLLLLPETPMKKRIFDPRVGFFSNQYVVFGEESQKSEKEVFAIRWRLEPKNEADAIRQQNGELIEPKKPIVYYIDPATPKKWQPYLKAGVDDWAVAFENAGWKNAIRGEYWPEEDSTMSLEDARFSVLRYFAADIQNAYGPNVHDPRSGEILESHIGWYHNVMSLLRNWYMIQTAAVDPKARTLDFSDELMGELIRFVSSHEVGHTIGLRHNMGASSATPVEKLRDADWVAKNGHTSSIMDYARFNYVAQPEDGITDLFPRIGDYDKWAIKWGYSYIDESKDELNLLNDWTKEAYNDPRKRFGTEISPYDPRYQTEDLGDNAMVASSYGLKNLKRIVPKLTEWTYQEGESYKDLEEIYNNVVRQYRRYIGHVTKNVGGIYDTPKTYDMAGDVFEPVPYNMQSSAVSWLNSNVFQSPNWLMNQQVLSKIKPENGVEAIKSIQVSALNSLLAGDRAVRLLETTGTGNYSLAQLYTTLRDGIFSELKSGESISIERRNLQKVFVNKFIELLSEKKATVRSVPVGVAYAFNFKTVDLSTTDLPSLVRGNLKGLSTDLKKAYKKSKDQDTKFHIDDLLARITEALDPK